MYRPLRTAPVQYVIPRASVSVWALSHNTVGLPSGMTLAVGLSGVVADGRGCVAVAVGAVLVWIAGWCGR